MIPPRGRFFHAQKDTACNTRIPIPRPTLERLLVVLTRSYDRQLSREVKQATDTIKRLLEPEKNDRIA